MSSNEREKSSKHHQQKRRTLASDGGLLVRGSESDALQSGSGSLTATLFGDSNIGNVDHTFGSTSLSFHKAVAVRLHKNEVKAKKIKLQKSSDVTNKPFHDNNNDITEQSVDEIMTRRTKHAAHELVQEITCQAIHPTNNITTDIGKKTLSDLPLDVQIQDTVDIIKQHGFAVVQNVVSKELLDTLSECAGEIEQQICGALDDKGIPWRSDGTGGGLDQHVTTDFCFYEVASRCPGRMDSRYKTCELPFSDPAIVKNPSLLPIVHALLGGATAREESHIPTLVYAGLILSFPGSKDQPWHQDGMPLFTEQTQDGSQHIPAYALNIFLPLKDQDMSLEAGPTEFIPQSHHMPEIQVMSMVNGESNSYDFNKKKQNNHQNSIIVSPIIQQGDALIYDYRLCHRGTSNLTHCFNDDHGQSSRRVRKILYLMYARPWFKEHLNFGEETLF